MDKFGFKCNVCNLMFNNEVYFNDHILSHSNLTYDSNFDNDQDLSVASPCPPLASPHQHLGCVPSLEAFSLLSYDSSTFEDQHLQSNDLIDSPVLQYPDYNDIDTYLNQVDGADDFSIESSDVQQEILPHNTPSNNIRTASYFFNQDKQTERIINF